MNRLAIYFNILSFSLVAAQTDSTEIPDTASTAVIDYKNSSINIYRDTDCHKYTSNGESIKTCMAATRMGGTYTINDADFLKKQNQKPADRSDLDSNSEEYGKNLIMVSRTKVEWKQYGYVDGHPNWNYQVVKRYSICRVDDECVPRKRIGIFASKLMKDVEGNGPAKVAANKLLATSIVEAGIVVSIPVFMILGISSLIDYSEKMAKAEDAGLPTSGIESDHKTYFGLAVGFLIPWWICSFIETAQLNDVSKAFNSKNKVSIKVNPEKMETGVSYSVGF